MAGAVFFLERRHGLLFTADYMINTKNLSPEDREKLGVYRYLLTDPNRDNELFREESRALRRLAIETGAMIFPGHGKYYRPESD
jgi:glyoxylase-like metal-dependent hydrolase (beta-lactamase superfamily II)